MSQLGNADIASRMSGSELDRSFVRGIAWSGAAKWSSQLISWASTIVVARILSPADFGLITMAAIYLGLVAVVSEFGVGSAVVTLRDMTCEEIAQLNGLAVVLGFFCFLVSCAIAVPMGRFFSTHQLPIVIILMSTTFIIAGFSSIPNALLQRELRFKLLSVIDGTRSLALSLLTVLLAVAGLRYWTLVLAAIFNALIGTAWILYCRRYRFAWPHWRTVRPAISFSRDVLISRLSWYCYSNADFAVAGRVFGQVALGFYTIAWNFANVPIEKITNLVSSVTPAYFSAVQHDHPGLRRYLLKPTEAIAILTFPIMIGLALVSREAVLLVLGPKWIAAVPALQILALYACLRSVTPLVPQVLFAAGASRFVMWNSLAYLVVMPTAFIVGSRWGVAGIAAGWAVAYPVVTAPLYWRLFRSVHLKLAEYLSVLAPALCGSVVMGIVVISVRSMLRSNVPAIFMLFIEITCGAVAYAATLLTLFRPRIARMYRGIELLRG